MPLLKAHFGGLFSFMEFTKSISSITAQMELLKQRGLDISNPDLTNVILSNVSYYRLSGYMHLFQKDRVTHEFKRGTSLGDVYDLYTFDRELKLIIFDAIERLEIAIKNQITIHLAAAFGNNWYENPGLFYDRDFYVFLQAHLWSEFRRSEEKFIVHYRNTYKKPLMPPSWMVLEILSFGKLSKIYHHINSLKEKREISSYFKTHDNVFHSWLHTLVYLRNLCAHHSRLISRKLTFTPVIPTRKKNRLLLADIDNNSLYAYLCIISYLLKSIQSECLFSDKIIKLSTDYPDINLNKLGFTSGWQHENLWKP